MDETRGRITRDGIRIHEDADFPGMAAAGRVAAEILDMIGPLVAPGVTTEALDDFIFWMGWPGAVFMMVAMIDIGRGR